MNQLQKNFTVLLLCCIFGTWVTGTSYRHYRAQDLELSQGKNIKFPTRGYKCRPILALDVCDCEGSVDKTTFSKLTQLRLLNFTTTQIDYFSSNTFSSLTKLETVFFSSSSVTFESTSKGSSRTALQYFKELSFKSTNVSTLSSNALYDLRSLEKLTIDSCAVTNTNSNVFSNLNKITHLSITSSRLESFDLTVISHLNSLEYLAIYEVQTSVEINYSSFGSLTNLQTICFDGSVYNELNFELFTSLKTVEIIVDKNGKSSVSSKTVEYLQSKNIECKYVTRD